MYIDKLASQIKNDVLSGLKGYHQNLGLNIEQLKDEVVNTRLLLRFTKNIIVAPIPPPAISDPIH